MRNLMLLLVGALLGAVAFHLYYRHLAPSARCEWDHPVDASARADCRTGALVSDVHGYAVKARRDLDSLIGNISR